MKRNFIEIYNDTSLSSIHSRLDWQQYKDSVTDREEGVEVKPDLPGDRSLEKLYNSTYFDSITLDSSSNVIAARTNSSLDFPTFEEFIEQIKNTSTAYTTSTPLETESDANDFSIEVKFGAGTTDFTTEMKAAIEDAADVWEDAILQSSFSKEHTLTIEVRGEDLGADGFEAKASLEAMALRRSPEGNFLPTEGNSTVNTNTEMRQKFAENREYFTNLMAHEFGHVMGIGTLWKVNDLIDTDLGGYRADTQAGNVYNTNRLTETNIPLTTGQGKGSDDLHWREEIFDNELMTHEGESIGSSEPLSIMTLASLEDLGWNVNYRVSDVFPNPETGIV